MHSRHECIRAINVSLQNDIPVFCPALTDGSIGDMIYFHKYKRPEFLLDISGNKIARSVVSASPRDFLFSIRI